ncbi:MAG: hypothetical protein M0Q26_09970 [Chitinophagaceae bacterium]|nr:hypothetical protein [Chitinophagaceae bacterium]
MGIADDFMSSFFEHYPEARSGKLSMEELNRLMAEFQHKGNNSPLDDFDGLSPAQMNVLLYEPLSGNCILQFNRSMDQHLEEVPLLQLSELLLMEIRDAGKLKLTVKGNLPVRVCELLYSQQLIKWEYMEYMKRVREEDIPYIGPLKHYLLSQGIIKKRDNAFSLTEKGAEFLKESRAARFISLFLFFAGRFHWGNFYGLQDNGKYGQLGWAFSLVLLSKYGDKARESQIYSLKVMQAFEKELWDTRGAKGKEEHILSYNRAYAVRFFDCFANWFGLVNIERKKNLSISFFDQRVVRKSELFDQLFEPITDKSSNRG